MKKKINNGIIEFPKLFVAKSAVEKMQKCKSYGLCLKGPLFNKVLLHCSSHENEKILSISFSASRSVTMPILSPRVIFNIMAINTHKYMPIGTILACNFSSVFIGVDWYTKLLGCRFKKCYLSIGYEYSSGFTVGSC